MKIKKINDFIAVNEMGMAVKNRKIEERQKLSDKLIRKYGLKYNPQTDSFDCVNKYYVVVEDDLVEDGRLKIKFGEVKGSFSCNSLGLITLEGCPQKVGGYFDCEGNKLTSLEGAPKFVGGNFDCTNNKSLIYDEEHFYGCLPDVIGGELQADEGEGQCDMKVAEEYFDKD